MQKMWNDYEQFDAYMRLAYAELFTEHTQGFECGSGWWALLDQLCRQIQHWQQWQLKRNALFPRVTITQVKEKFGDLRFYYEGGDDYVSGLVAMAEGMSSQLCEQCGSPGYHRSTGGWLSTLCDTHYSKRMAGNYA
jgi:hypothetical protein